MEKIEGVRSGDFVPKSMRGDKKRKAEEAPQDDETPGREGQSNKGSKKRKSEKEGKIKPPQQQLGVDAKAVPKEKHGLEKLEKQLGSLIGRKRKMRKGK